MERKSRIRFNILAIITIIILCFAITPKTFQNDTYYTIRIGELIQKNGIDMQDHFSWHELPYTYPHWAYDVGISWLYDLGESTGIQDGGMLFIYISTIIFTSIIGILIYFICSKLTKNKLVSYIVTLFAVYTLRDFIAARAQVVTFILFILTVLFIENFIKTKNKWNLLGLVIISIIIANVHVAVWPFFFVIFLPYIAEYLIAVATDKNLIGSIIVFNKKDSIKDIERKIEKIKKSNKANKTDKLEALNKKLELKRNELEHEEKKLEAIKEVSTQQRSKPYKIEVEKISAVKWLVLVMAVCLLTGLLTPLGDTPYTYLVKTMQGNTTKSINEHLPLVLYNDKETIVILVMFLSMLIFTDSKIKLRDLFMLSGLIFLTFMSRRQVSLLVILGVFIFAKLLTQITEKYDKDGCERFQKFMTTWTGKVCTLGFIIVLSFAIYKPKIDDPYIEKNSYPVEAATWILENLNVNEIKLYNEYNYGSYLLYRGIPVFIDSRADLYAPEFNKTKNENGEVESKNIFSDYISVASIGTYYDDKFESYGITHVITMKNSKINLFISRNDKYKELYSDDNFVIYERNTAK